VDGWATYTRFWHGALDRVLYRSGGDSTLPSPFSSLSCVRSNLKWLPQSTTIRIGSAITLKLSTLATMWTLPCPMYICTGTRLLRLVMTFSNCLMVVISQRLQNPVWMHFFLSLVTLAEPSKSIFSRNNMSGSFKCSTWLKRQCGLFLSPTECVWQDDNFGG